MSTYNYQFKRNYLIEEKVDVSISMYGGEPERLQLEDVDFKILKILSADARITIADIGNKLGIIPNTIKYHIAKLTKLGIIQGYRLFIDLNKIGYEWYKSLISLRDISESKHRQILTFCKSFPEMLYFVQSFGSWDVEIEVNVKNNAEFRKIWTELRNKFSENILDYDTLLIYKEHKLNYFPFHVETILKENEMRV